MRIPLLGEGHRKIADGLVERIHRVQDNETVPRVVLLRGASGVGKSRIIREVYERLRQVQPSNADGLGYWPALPHADDTWVPGRENLPVRKALGPTVEAFERPPGTLPAFFWWPVACDQMPDGTLVDVIDSLDTQLSAHFPYLVAAFRERVGRGERFRKWLRGDAPKEALGAGREGGLEAFAVALDAAGVAVPGAGYALTTSLRAGKAWRQHRELAREVRAGGGLADGKPNAAEQLFEQITRVLHPELPLVLVVEDLHLMGSSFADLLGYLAQPLENKPVAVIGTVWPEAATRKTYRGWLSGAEDLVETVDVPALQEADLIELARTFAPDSQPEPLRLVAQRWTNPYALILLMTDSRVRRAHIRDGMLVIYRSDLRRLPNTIRGLYERRWDELPDQVRSALMLAAGCLPAGQGDVQMWPFQSAIVADTARAAEVLDDPAWLVDALGDAVVPFEWLKQRDGALDLEQFGEWVLVSIARAACVDTFGDVDLVSSAVRVLCEWFEAKAAEQETYFLDPDDPVLVPTARWLIELVGTENDRLGIGIAALTLAWSFAQSYDYPKALEVLSRERWRLLGEDHPDALTARSHVASWMGELENHVGALEMSQELLADQTRLLGAFHVDTLSTRNTIAEVTADLGDPNGALKLSWSLYGDQSRILGIDHLDTLVTRNNIAFLRGEVGDAEGALKLFEELLDDQIRVLGSDHPNTLLTRSNIAYWTGELGDPGGALELFRSLLDDQVRVLGADHPDCLSTRGSLADWTAAGGALDSALRLCQALLADQIRLLGTRHPDTWKRRSHTAHLTGQMGDPEGALTLFEALLIDLMGVLGPDHPFTLATRNGVAVWTGEAGDDVAALEFLEELLTDQVRVLGIDHPDVAITRGKIADVRKSLDSS